ncbi:hypothetical protein [Xylella fastidiosa]|nr:hypothetical protein [Xylella fastidiosa]
MNKNYATAISGTSNQIFKARSDTADAQDPAWTDNQHSCTTNAADSAQHAVCSFHT